MKIPKYAGLRILSISEGYKPFPVDLDFNGKVTQVDEFNVWVKSYDGNRTRLVTLNDHMGWVVKCGAQLSKRSSAKTEQAKNQMIHYAIEEVNRNWFEDNGCLHNEIKIIDLLVLLNQTDQYEAISVIRESLAMENS